MFWKRKKEKKLEEPVEVPVPIERKEEPTSSYAICGEVLKVIYTDAYVHVFFVDKHKVVRHVVTSTPEIQLSDENKVKVKYKWVEKTQYTQGYYDYEIIELGAALERIEFKVS